MTTTVPGLARLDLMTVEEYMHAGLIACDPAAPLATVAWILADEHIHCVVVTGLEQTNRSARATWGALTDRDLMRALAERADARSAGDLASEPVVTVEPTDRLDRVVELMVRHDVSHLLVTEYGSPVGIISSLDVARAAAAR